MEDLYKKTTYIGTNLDNEKTKWVAFPVVALDGENESIVISASKYDMAYLNPNDMGYNHNIMPTSGVFLLKHRETLPNNNTSKLTEEPDVKLKESNHE